MILLYNCNSFKKKTASPRYTLTQNVCHDPVSGFRTADESLVFDIVRHNIIETLLCHIIIFYQRSKSVESFTKSVLPMFMRR